MKSCLSPASSLQSVWQSCWLQQQHKPNIRESAETSHKYLCIIMHVLVSLLYACRFATILLNQPLPQHLPFCTHWAEARAHWLTRISSSSSTTSRENMLLEATETNVRMFFVYLNLWPQAVSERKPTMFEWNAKSKRLRNKIGCFFLLQTACTAFLYSTFLKGVKELLSENQICFLSTSCMSGNINSKTLCYQIDTAHLFSIIILIDCELYWVKCTWHVALCFPTLDPLATLVPPVVLVCQNHINVDVVVGRRFQDTDVEAQKREHPPA